MCREELELSEDEKLYPPRFVVNVKASNTAGDFRADFKFEGATEDITKEIIFTNGMVHINVISMTYIFYIIVFHSPKELHLVMTSRRKFA